MATTSVPDDFVSGLRSAAALASFVASTDEGAEGLTVDSDPEAAGVLPDPPPQAVNAIIVPNTNATARTDLPLYKVVICGPFIHM
jgi:hypothetical protein